MRSWISAALSVYAESLVLGRRVLVVGSADTGIADRLARLGARSVHVFEPVTSHAEVTERGVVVQPLPAGDFDVRDGAFDFALVAEVSELRDPAALLARLRRVLGPAGAALIATGRAGDDAYYGLFEAVALQFASVVMLANVAFRGLVIAELGRPEGDLEVSVDTQLITRAGLPIGFAALVGQHELHLAPYTLVELPAARDEDADAAHEATSIAQIAQAQLIADLQRSQLDEERSRRHDHEREVHLLSESLAAEKSARAAAERGSVSLEDFIVARERAAAVESSLQVAEDGAFTARERVAALEAALLRREEEALVLAAELDVLRNPPPASDDARVLALLAEVSLLQTELAKSVGARASADGVERAKALAEAELGAELRGAKAECARLGDALAQAFDVHAEELSVLEERLRDRAAAVRSAEGELRHREQVGRELLIRLDAAMASPPASPDAELRSENAALTNKLDAAALAWARHQSAIEASAWSLSELESRLETARDSLNKAASELELQPELHAVKPEVKDSSSGSDAHFQAKNDLEAQLDALRAALAQEHLARVHAESGEALVSARVEIARQASLLAQISAQERLSDAIAR